MELVRFVDKNKDFHVMPIDIQESIYEYNNKLGIVVDGEKCIICNIAMKEFKLISYTDFNRISDSFCNLVDLDFILTCIKSNGIKIKVFYFEDKKKLIDWWIS